MRPNEVATVLLGVALWLSLAGLWWGRTAVLLTLAGLLWLAISALVMAALARAIARRGGQP
jgi:hypothetical protein